MAPLPSSSHLGRTIDRGSFSQNYTQNISPSVCYIYIYFFLVISGSSRNSVTSLEIFKGHEHTPV